MAARPLTRADVAAMAENIRDLLADEDAKLSRSARLRWEGALTAVELILGAKPSLARDDLERLTL